MGRKAIIAIMVVIVLAGGVGGYEAYAKYAKQRTTETNESVVKQALQVDNRATDDGPVTTGEVVGNKLADMQVLFAGIEDCTVNSNTIIMLSNPKENTDIYMKFEISAFGKLIYDTDLIPAGQSIEWKIGDYLKPGSYDVDMKQIPYYDDNGNYIQLISPTNQVHITIEN